MAGTSTGCADRTLAGQVASPAATTTAFANGYRRLGRDPGGARPLAGEDHSDPAPPGQGGMSASWAGGPDRYWRGGGTVARLKGAEGFQVQ
jgi:hypothetical protein